MPLYSVAAVLLTDVALLLLIALQGGVAYISHITGGSFSASNCDFSGNSAVRDPVLVRLLAWFDLLALSFAARLTCSVSGCCCCVWLRVRVVCWGAAAGSGRQGVSARWQAACPPSSRALACVIWALLLFVVVL